MKTFLLVLLLILTVATVAVAQETATVKFRWTQPVETMGGQPMADGWMKSYNVYLAAHGDTTLYALVEAPFAIADSASVNVTLEIGVPSAIQVEGIDKWDQIGPLRSLWSDTHIVIPEPPAMPGKPGAVE